MGANGNVRMVTSGQFRGTIKSIKRAEGYGFITHTETGIDHFFHRSVVKPLEVWETLRTDQLVDFVPAEGARGPRASEVWLAP